MITFYEMLTVVTIDLLLIFDKNSGNTSINLNYGNNPSVFSLLRHTSGRGLNPFLGSINIPMKLEDVRNRKWAKVNSKSMKYSAPDKHILGHDYDRFDVTRGISDFIKGDDFFHELLLHAYKQLGSDTVVIDKTKNPLVNNKFIQTLALNLAYFMFIAQMEYGNNAMKLFIENRAIINSPQWWAVAKIGGFSARSLEAALKLQLVSSSAITNSMNKKLRSIKGKSGEKAGNGFLNNGPGAVFPTNATLVYVIDLNNNMYSFIKKFSKLLDLELANELINTSNLSNSNIFRTKSNTLTEKKLARRLKTYMYIVTEARDQFDNILMSGGAWLSDHKAAYLATWRFSNTRMSKDIFKAIKFSENNF